VESTPFVVLFMGRCGSTWLTSLLGSHPDVKCRREEFALVNGQGKESPEQRTRVLCKFFEDTLTYDPTPEQCLKRVARLFSREALACGFKFKYPNQVESYPEVMDALRRRADELRVIHLTRSNLLKRAVSRQNLLRRLKGTPRVATTEQERKVKTEKLIIDIPLLMSYMARQQRQFDRLEKIVNEFPHVIQVEYEDLVKEQNRVMTSVLTFLGVDPTAELTSNLIKATPDRLVDIVANHDEVVAAISNSAYARFLDES
jgi:LPS sulfotransferase NodH